MKKFILGFYAILALNISYSQCVADFDFGDVEMGVSPNPMAGESLVDGLVGADYTDVMHLLLPAEVLSIDSTLQLPEGTLLDSLELISIVMIDFYDESNTYAPEDMGLTVVCNNNGDSGNPCSFLGNSQYCASIEGTPTVAGLFRCAITIKGWVAFFGTPMGQEAPFGELMLLVESEGCTDPTACNYDENAAIDDGSCIYECYGCTDMDANNYDDSANMDDGSCCYLSIDPVTTDALCYGSYGMVDIAVSGTESTVLFGIDPIFSADSSFAYDLLAGTYVLSAYDLSDNMCEAEATFTINQPEELMITASATDASALGSGVGSVYATGGIGECTITWSEAVGGNLADPNNLEQGDYEVYAVDANGCSASTFVTVLWNLVESISEVEFNIFPNPSNGVINLRSGSLVRNATIDIFDTAGRTIKSISNITLNGSLQIDLNDVNEGIYIISISSDKGRTVKHLQIIK